MRTKKQRQDHVLELLSHGRDVWFATAGPGGHPHLVPFSLGWDGSHIIVATELHSVTVRNIRASHLARLAVGDTRNVVLIDARVAELPIPELEPAAADVYARRNGWDPRQSSTAMVWLICTPKRIQAWHDEAELDGRTIMNAGRWVV